MRICASSGRYQPEAPATIKPLFFHFFSPSSKGVSNIVQRQAPWFRGLKAHKQLPILRAAILAHQAKHAISPNLELHAKAT
jgi:hypothetical protein